MRGMGYPPPTLSTSPCALLNNPWRHPDLYPLQSHPQYDEVKHREVQRTQSAQQLKGESFSMMMENLEKYSPLRNVRSQNDAT